MADAKGKLSIAIWTGGGLGDLLSTSGFLERLFLEHGRPIIDVFSDRRSYLSFVFNNAVHVRRLMPNYLFGQFNESYDLVIHVHRTASYEMRRPHRVASLASSLLWCAQTSGRRNDKEFWAHIREMPYLDGDLAKRAVLSGLNRKSLLGYSGAVSFGRDDWIYLSPDITALGIFKKLGLSPYQYITVHDGFDTNVTTGVRSTKQWSSNSWQTFVGELRTRHPNMKTVQIGGSNSNPIGGTDINLVGRVDFHHVAWLLKYAACHVDNESGLVRLAREVGGRSVVIFGPTDPDFFGFAENINLRPHLCGNCFWSTRDWLTQCPRTLKVPECTDSIKVPEVVAAVERILATRGRSRLAVLDASLFDTIELSNAESALSEIPALAEIPRAPALQRVTADRDAVHLEVTRHWEYLYVPRMLIHHAACGTSLRVADLSCSSGMLASYLTKSGAQVAVFKLDHSRDHGGAPEADDNDFGTGKRPGLEERYGSVFNLPAASDSFDVAYLSGLEHLAFKAFAMREALRILRPGGILALTLVIANTSASAADARGAAFSPDRLSSLLRELEIDCPMQFTALDVDRAAALAQDMGVSGLAPGITVAGITIRKSLLPS